MVKALSSTSMPAVPGASYAINATTTGWTGTLNKSGSDTNARQYNISVDTLMTVNNMQAGTSVQPDQELLILPVDGVLHIVRPGQTLARISELYGASSIKSK
jgi:hypothetical protein